MKNSCLKLPDGLWKLKDRPYYPSSPVERHIPWGSTLRLEDSHKNNKLFEETGIEIGTLIGTGTFSTVFSAWWKEYRMPIAVKIYEKNSLTESSLSAISTEIRVLKLVKHPNLMSLYGVRETQFKIYFLFELIGNGNLLEYLEANDYVEETQAKKWFIQLASGTKYLHDLGIAHRDIKCDNILVDMSLNIRLSDFGFATTDIPWDASIPNTGWKKYSDYCGSLAYSSPEILLETPYSPLLADVWAIGVVLYATLFGKFPFDMSDFENFNPIEMPTLVEFPETPKISIDCAATLKRIFLLEKRRPRSVDLVRCDWVKEETEEIYLAENGLFTLQEIKEMEETKKRLELMTKTQNSFNEFWGERKVDPSRHATQHCIF